MQLSRSLVGCICICCLYLCLYFVYFVFTAVVQSICWLTAEMDANTHLPILHQQCANTAHTEHIAHCTLNTAPALCTALPCTLHTAHTCQYCTHCTLHTAHTCTHSTHCTLHTAHILHSAHTAHCTVLHSYLPILHTLNTALHTLHTALDSPYSKNYSWPCHTIPDNVIPDYTVQCHVILYQTIL